MNILGHEQSKYEIKDSETECNVSRLLTALKNKTHTARKATYIYSLVIWRLWLQSPLRYVVRLECTTYFCEAVMVRERSTVHPYE